MEQRRLACGGEPDAEAAWWFVQRQTRPWSAVDEARFQEWLAQDLGHRSEFEHHERAWSIYDRLPQDLLGELLSPPLDHATSMERARAPLPRGRRFNRRAAALTLAAALSALAVGLGSLYLEPADTYAYTHVGQTRSVALPDGSSVLLNTNSAIAVRFTTTGREVELLRGEADFKVTREAGRPFVVHAAGGWTRALGTEFIVHRDSDGATVTGIVHAVAVGMEGAAALGESSLSLAPGERAHYTRQTGVERLPAVDVELAGTWRNGWLTFEDRPLGEVIEELNRYHTGVIRITDERLRELRVTCVVPLSKPIAVVDSLEQTLGLKSTRVGNYLILIHR